MRKIRSTSKSTNPTTAPSIFHNSCATWEDVDDKHRHQFSSPIKGVYDLAFSEDPFYGEQRSEFLGGIQHCVEQAKEGYHNPPLPAVYVRKPFKILLGILMFVFFLAVLIGGLYEDKGPPIPESFY